MERVFVDTATTLFTTDARFLSFSFLPSQPTFEQAFAAPTLLPLLRALGPSYFQWQDGNAVVYNITGGELSPCGTPSAPKRCAGPHVDQWNSSQQRPLAVLQKEDWDACLDFVASAPSLPPFPSRI